MEVAPRPEPDPDEVLKALAPLFRPLPPAELERRTQLYREAGMLDRETITRVMAGEFS